jgi:hypothetical protein
MDALESDLLDKENLALFNPYLVGLSFVLFHCPCFVFSAWEGEIEAKTCYLMLLWFSAKLEWSVDVSASYVYAA